MLLSAAYVNAQENSPFSRYGLGDLYPQQPAATRAMGGISAAYVNPQAINTVNPASYGFIPVVTFDVGITIDQRTLKSATPPSTYNSANFLPSYIQIATPIDRARGWGGVFGLRPAARINYSVEDVSRTSVDSLQKLYQGNGGLTQAFMGIGKRWGKYDSTSFSIGLNVGYEFGRRETNNIINYIDSTPYTKSNYGTTTSYGGFFFNPGVQLAIRFKEKSQKVTNLKRAMMLRLGAAATFKHDLTGDMNTIIETFDYDANGAMVPIDTIAIQNGINGKIKIPSNYVAGFTLSNMLTDYGISKWSIGADYSASKWSDYTFFGQTDKLVNSWMVHTGAEFVPDPFSQGLWGRSTYHVGYYTGKDYINADGNGYNVSAVTFGLGFMLKRYRGQYDNQQTLINTSFEIGKRGSAVNNITESFFKFSVGFSLSDLWFIKRRYD
ncbi:MAG TPA: hypothetical protein VHB48_00125 [Chitinophagaceae bacterium]|nr:hypothetical protein [Chitinophagaceae bacterium]